MTEQEAKDYARRLQLIWLSGDEAGPVVEWRPMRDHPDRIAFAGQVAIDVHLLAEETSPVLGVTPTCRFTLGWEHEGVWPIRIMCHARSDRIVSARLNEGGVSQAVAEQFENRWRPFVRRSCWLSGIPVKATDAEKAEWLKSLTREEIEAWNLRI